MSTITVTAAQVNQLRQATGAGMMDCKKALIEAEGDFDGAIDYLRKKGQKVASNRADRDAKEGVCVAAISHNRNSGVMLKVSCETDFVAVNEQFVALANDFATIAIKNLPADTAALLSLPYDADHTIGSKIEQQIGVIGEKIEIADYAKIETAAGEGQVVSYIHMGNRAAVILALNLEGTEYIEAGKNCAMQVAAMRPVAVDAAGVDATMIQKEIEIGKELARNEGKPEAMLDRIAEGRLQKFYKENTLLAQQYVKDGGLTVAQYLQSLHKNLTVSAFKNTMLG